MWSGILAFSISFVVTNVLFFNKNNKQMQIPPIDQPQIPFGYSSKLKTYYKRGKFPSVKYGFYGDRLTKDNVSLEHLLPHSKGGRTTLDNLVLASKQNNMARGNRDIANYLDPDNLKRYIEQFIPIKLPDFNGKQYVMDILKTINKLLDK